MMADGAGEERGGGSTEDEIEVYRIGISNRDRNERARECSRQPTLSLRLLSSCCRFFVKVRGQ